jgi:cellulose synthase/poly-beta-1,6-N-acetylglucosamine synthase-like glycosyltransferase
MVVILPAHNEAEYIAQSVLALHKQTRTPDVILVSADNCTDDTEELARHAGASVFVTKGNTEKRSGAVNQPLVWMLPYLQESDIVVMADADTLLAPTFLENAERLLKGDYDAVGPTFDTEPTWSVVEQLQHNEYARYSRMTDRRNGRTLNLSGAAQVLTVRVIRAVIQARTQKRLPGGPAMYNTGSISEDMELTIAIKTLGFRTVASPHCRCITDMMPTIKSLWIQRIRWVQGGMVELRRYGRTPITRPMILRQWISGANIVFTALWMVYAVLLTCAVGWQRFDLMNQPLWMAFMAFFACERAFTARNAGWRGALVASLLIPEFLYDLFRQTVFITSLARHLRGTEIRWS